MNELITSQNEHIRSLHRKIDDIILYMDKVAKNSTLSLKGEKFLTDKEVSEKLKISRRTLQEYRNNLILPFILLGGKIIYRESDIEKMLIENYVSRQKY